MAMIRSTITIAAALLVAASAQGLSDADKCEASKLSEAGKYLLCRLKAESKAVKIAATPDYSKCDIKLGDRFGKVETAAGGQCCGDCGGDGQVSISDLLTAVNNALGGCGGGMLPDCPADLSTCRGNLGACETDLATCEAQTFGSPPSTGQTGCWDSAGTPIACAGTGQDGEFQNGAARSFVDNADGTITDTYTGLMWEKLGDDDSIHDKDTAYNWDEAFATKVATLNSGSFAGYTDWRVPNRNELLTIWNPESLSHYSAFAGPCSGGCSEQTCSCAQSSNYWSSTTYEPNPTDAWGVYFGTSNPPRLQHQEQFPVRSSSARRLVIGHWVI